MSMLLFGNRRLLKRLIISYSLLIIIAVVIMLSLVSYLFTRKLIERTSDLVGQQMELIAKDIEERLSNVREISEDIRRNPQIRKILTGTVSPFEANAAATTTLSVYYGAKSKDYLISRMILMAPDGTIYDDVYGHSLYADAIRQHPDFLYFIQNDLSYYFSQPSLFPKAPPDAYLQDKLTAVLYNRLLDDAFLESIGYLLTVMRTNILFQSLQQDTTKVFSGLTLVNARQETIYSSGTAIDAAQRQRRSERQEQQPGTLVNIGGERFLCYARPLVGVDWTFWGVVAFDDVTREVKLLIGYVVLAGIVVLLVSVALNAYLANSITRPIFQLSNAMKAIETQGLPESLHIKADGEIRYLVDQFNAMIGNLKRLIADIYQEQQERREAELNSLQYELDSLQAQINPHFLHNTLNAIGYLAEKAEQTDIHASIVSLNALLRAALSGVQECIPIDEELALVEYFLDIQRLRYGEDFSAQYHVQPGIRQARIPKLILQPIVENAIFHGIEPLDIPGKIDIIIQQDEQGEICIMVKDNGVGMEPVERFQDLPASERRRTFNKIGLHNVHDRIRILFGEAYGLSIQSTRGKGTTVTLRVPEIFE
ncbi:hypothetical protein CSA56_15045 [candidate division KSB3 bacterium]|uniref:HAMP domain-containing protein n=1 Tax=candidate division KSB3 bacterium TaxID=2044937 RepID=A0A2G6KCI1_9BACT|nr:MAG: hypothetical protein CSA56_15045 [candidate division KSB3 bacterium]